MRPVMRKSRHVWSPMLLTQPAVTEIDGKETWSTDGDSSEVGYMRTKKVEGITMGDVVHYLGLSCYREGESLRDWSLRLTSIYGDSFWKIAG